jgi:diguanylate cyclase (GGDEF)-like protein
LATSDPLSSLFNRGYVNDRLRIELSRARRYGKELAVAVIDADHLKALNDTHGHLAGDTVLTKIGELLRNSFRQSDTTERYGGEGFVLILPEIDIETARREVESLRELVASAPVVIDANGENVQVTISAGVASPSAGPRGCRGAVRFGGRTDV